MSSPWAPSRAGNIEGEGDYQRTNTHGNWRYNEAEKEVVTTTTNTPFAGMTDWTTKGRLRAGATWESGLRVPTDGSTRCVWYVFDFYPVR